MEKPMIGIRQADGSFYSIMDDARSGNKRLVLSAARTDQHGVRIDLYRSTDGTIETADALGEISLDDPQGLGYQDIEFRLSLDETGQLDASAALPGQAPSTLKVDLTPFREVRTDSEILSDPNLDSADLDTLDEEFGSAPDEQAMVLDLPDLEDLDESPQRSDADILSDAALDGAELDTLDEFSFEDLDEPQASDQAEMAEPVEGADFDEGLMELGEVPDLADDDLAIPEDDPLPALETPAAAEAFDLGDLDAGFGDDPLPEIDEPAANSPETEALDDWEKISLDDMEPMEFMDTGDEISSPKTAPAATPSARSAAPEAAQKFSMDEDEPLELGDFGAELEDFPELGTMDELDSEFMAPAALTDPPPQKTSGKAARPEKPAKNSKPERKQAPAPSSANEGPSGLDKTALFLALTALSLLVLLVLVLLFLNMVKGPPAPVIKPEVMKWNPSTSQMPVAQHPDSASIDLGDSRAPTFQAQSVLEVPEGLRAARVTLRLGAGDSVERATRRFGAPQRQDGAVLSW